MSTKKFSRLFNENSSIRRKSGHRQSGPYNQDQIQNNSNIFWTPQQRPGSKQTEIYPTRPQNYDFFGSDRGYNSRENGD